MQTAIANWRESSIALFQKGGFSVVAQVDSRYIKMRPTKLASRLVSWALFEGRPLTTRGRWINPLVFSQLRVWKHLPQIKRVEKPVFILGAGRSGTTVLGMLLSMHRDVGFLNEPKAMWHVIYPAEDVIGSYARGDARFRLDANDGTSDVRRIAHRLFGAYLAAVFTKRVVDKYPELIFRVPFVRRIFPDARFIFLVRNGWDTCDSVASWSKKHGRHHHREVHDWWGVDRRKWLLMVDELIASDPCFDEAIDAIRGFDSHVDMAATEWVVTMREGLRCLREHGRVVRMIRYEDLINDPERTLESILDFCELEKDRILMRYAMETLRPSRPHSHSELDPAILPLFQETLNALGYKGRS